MSAPEKNLGFGFEKRHKLRAKSRDELNKTEPICKQEELNKETMMVKGPDGEMVECEIVSTRDHESMFNKHAPILPLPLAIICCILNIVPGLGTWTGGFMAPCSLPNKEGSKCKTFLVALLTGFLQLLLTPVIAGILWSISYGVMLVRKSQDAKSEKIKNSSIKI